MTEGIFTLIGVVLGAFIAWWIAHWGKRKQQRAVAWAMAIEIAGFYRLYQKHIRTHLDGVDVLDASPPTFSGPVPRSFSVYEMNAQTFGDFSRATAESVVGFHALAGWFLSTVEDYQSSLAQELTLQKVVARDSSPRRLLAQLQSMMSKLDTMALDACRQLSKEASKDFNTLPLTG